MKTPSQHRLVAIVGGSGAGKGWLAGRLGLLLGGQAGRLSLDDFYHDRSSISPGRRARLNFDSPDAIDWELARQTFHDCRAGRPARLPRYDFITHSRLPATTACSPRPLVLVEGLSLLVHADVREFFDLKVYLDCPSDLRLQRRLTRDVAERGRSPESVRSQFDGTVAPMHALHVEPQRRWADVILTQPFRREHVRQLSERLWTLLTDTAPLPAWMRVPFHHELLNLLECHDTQS